MKSNQKGFGLVSGLLIIGTIGLLGFIGWYVWQVNYKTSTAQINTPALSPKANAQQPPAPQTAPLVPPAPPTNNVTETFDFPEGAVHLTHDATWQKTAPTQMKKTIAKRSFIFQIQINTYDPVLKIGDDYLKKTNFGGNLKTFISYPGPHGDLFVLKDGNQHVYLSSCPASSDGYGCSPPLSDKNSTLYVSLNLDVPNAQYAVELDLTQPEDQQALNDFIAILKTIKY